MPYLLNKIAFQTESLDARFPMPFRWIFTILEKHPLRIFSCLPLSQLNARIVSSDLFSGSNVKILRDLTMAAGFNCRRIRSRGTNALMARGCRVDLPKNRMFDPVDIQTLFAKKNHEQSHSWLH